MDSNELRKRIKINTIANKAFDSVLCAGLQVVNECRLNGITERDDVISALAVYFADPCMWYDLIQISDFSFDF